MHQLHNDIHLRPDSGVLPVKTTRVENPMYKKSVADLTVGQIGYVRPPPPKKHKNINSEYTIN